MSVISIRNLYYLLCYAWDILPQDDLVRVGHDDPKQAQDLLGAVLANGLSRLVRRGLPRGYRQESLTLSGVSGQIEFSPTIARVLLPQAKTQCRVWRLTHDTPNNRVIKATIRSLVKSPTLDTIVEKRLVQLYRQLAPVTDINLNTDAFRLLTPNRSSRDQTFLIRVCELVFRNLLVDERGSIAEFTDFTRNENLMSRLFERFLLRFFQREQTEYRASARTLGWQAAKGENQSIRLLPRLETDVTLDSSSRTVVIEAKFYRQTLVTDRWGGKRLRPDHLRQVFAYVRNLAVLESSKEVEGVLVYPLAGPPLDLDVVLHGHRIRAVTVDLNQSWRGLKADLLGLLSKKHGAAKQLALVG